MNLRGLTPLLLTMACANPLLADDASWGFRLWPRSWTRVSDCPCLGGSPDDYCRKACPTLIPISHCGAPDDYCRKIAPCLTDGPRCGSPDDYCKKIMPNLLCPPVTPYQYYGAGEPGCAAGKRR